MKKLLSILISLALILSFASCAQETATYKVGICEYTQHSAQSEVVKGFTDYLTEKLGDEISFDFQNASNDSSMATTIMNTFVSNNVDLILADNTQSLQIAANTTFDIPVLGAAITDYNSALGMSPDGINVSGTSDLAPLDMQADMIVELFPEAKTVGLVYCSSEVNSLYQVNLVQERLLEKGIKAVEYSFSDSNDIIFALEKACDEVEVIYLPTDNTLASCIEAVDSICRSAKIPVVTGEKAMCKGAGVATLSIDYYSLGRKTGEMAYKVLTEGADVSNMPIQYDENAVKLYNEEICNEFGITPPEGYLPVE